MDKVLLKRFGAVIIIAAVAVDCRVAVADQPRPTLLDPITVKGRIDQANQRDYSLPDTETATRTNTPIMETPFSVKVVPKQVFRDQQATRLDQVLQNVSGVNREVSNAGLADGITLRGFHVFPFRDGPATR